MIRSVTTFSIYIQQAAEDAKDVKVEKDQADKAKKETKKKEDKTKEEKTKKEEKEKAKDKEDKKDKKEKKETKEKEEKEEKKEKKEKKEKEEKVTQIVFVLSLSVIPKFLTRPITCFFPKDKEGKSVLSGVKDAATSVGRALHVVANDEGTADRTYEHSMWTDHPPTHHTSMHSEEKKKKEEEEESSDRWASSPYRFFSRLVWLLPFLELKACYKIK